MVRVGSQLIEAIMREYNLPPFGLHGLSHWARVYENGLLLAETTGANKDVVMLFSVLHDSRRRNEGIDPGHGERSAEFARTLRGRFIHIDDEDFELLYRACAAHTRGCTDEDITVQTCFDADRLDLARAGIYPQVKRLCTRPARSQELIAWAVDRSLRAHVPDFVFTEWGMKDIR